MREPGPAPDGTAQEIQLDGVSKTYPDGTVGVEELVQRRPRVGRYEPFAHPLAALSERISLRTASRRTMT